MCREDARAAGRRNVKPVATPDIAPDSFPRLRARTRRFTLGAPRSAVCLGDGSRALFLRSSGPEDLTNALWLSDAVADDETLLADPRVLLGQADERLSDEERARRERARESAGGIVAFSVDAAGDHAVFALSGRLWLTDVATRATRELTAHTPAIDPQISPDGTRVAYATGDEVYVVESHGDAWDREQLVVADHSGTVSWGLADFIAGEEMDRYHGLWWSPDSRALLVQRTDTAPEPVWYIADPAHPDRAPEPHRYPAALTSNAEVRLYLAHLSSGAMPEVAWDRKRFPYLASVHWSAGGTPLALVQSRDQQHDQVLGIDPASGRTTALAEHADPAWLDLLPGTPAWTPDGRLLTAVDDADTHRLALDGVPFTPVGLQIRRVLDVGDRDVLVAASADPRSVDLVLVDHDGTPTLLTDGRGVSTASRAGAGLVVTSHTMDAPGVTMIHSREGERHTVPSLAADPGIVPNVEFVELGEHGLHTALVRPRTATGTPAPTPASLPVLLAPYGGPGAQRVLFSQALYLEAQWWADQGFLVVIADGRGTPGRGPGWEREIREEFASVTLADQVDAVRALPGAAPEADLSRVAIRGWSYGGYLSALAVLRAPEVFHAAVAGAPPTDWTLYDTHYTERYLGLDPEAYRRNGLIEDAAGLRRPLLLVHGLADDNVAVAHTLRLSQALLAAGRPHSVLPLTGITHMPNDETVAENLLLLQLRFLRAALTEPLDPAPAERNHRG